MNEGQVVDVKYYQQPPNSFIFLQAVSQCIPLLVDENVAYHSFTLCREYGYSGEQFVVVSKVEYVLL